MKQQVITRISEKQNEELALRLSSLEDCNPNEIYSKEVMDIVQRTLQSTFEQTSRIFTLSRFGNKTNREIACELNISIKDVEYHISKSLKAFRKTLKDYLPLFYFFFTICNTDYYARSFVF